LQTILSKQHSACDSSHCPATGIAHFIPGTLGTLCLQVNVVVRQSPGAGRFVVAPRQMKSGELVL
jgi:hypothetical protein